MQKFRRRGHGDGPVKEIPLPTGFTYVPRKQARDLEFDYKVLARLHEQFDEQDRTRRSALSAADQVLS